MKYPTDLEFLEFFGAEPVVQDDVSVFTVSDDSGLELSLSFNTCDDSLQTLLKMGGRVVALVSHERLSRLWIDHGILRGEFSYENAQFSVVVEIQPYIHIEWVGLRSG